MKSELWYCSLFQNGSATKEISRYFDFNWFPWQLPFTNLKIRYRSIIYRKSAFIPWKDCENQSSISGDIRRNTLNHDVNTISRFYAETTGPIFTKFLHYIVALTTLLNPTHTRRYLVPFLNTTATNVESLPIFAQNRLPWQSPLRYRKNRSRSIIYTQTAFIQRKDCENRSWHFGRHATNYFGHLFLLQVSTIWVHKIGLLDTVLVWCVSCLLIF